MDAMTSGSPLGTVEDDVSTRPDSSRFSLGSSPSELSDADVCNADVDDDFTLDDVDGDGSLTPTEKIMEEEEEEEAAMVLNSAFDNDTDDDGLFEDISDTLSNAPPDIDEREVDDEVDAMLALTVSPKKPEKTPPPPPLPTTTITPLAADQPSSMSPCSGTLSPIQPILSPASDHETLRCTSSLKDNDNENVPPSPSQSFANTRKRRGSSTPLDQEERTKRRNSKYVEHKQAKSTSLCETEKGEDVEESKEYSESTGTTQAPDAATASMATVTAAAAADDDDDDGDGNPVTVRRQQEEEDHPMCTGDDEGTTEMNDDQEYQEWHREALNALTRIEIEFARLRDKMYDEKMSELNEEALMIAQGTHPDLVTMMATIEEKRNRRISTAEAWRKHKRLSCRQQFEGLEYQANIDFAAGKSALRREILAVLNRKRWDIDHERDKLNEPVTAADRVPDPTLHAHRRQTQLEETSDLRRIAQSIGFPMAPKPEGLAKGLIEDDLVALGVLQKPSEPTSKASSSAVAAANGHFTVEKSSRRHVSATTTSSSASTITSGARGTGRPHSRTRVPETESSYKDGLIYTSRGQLHYYGRVYEKGDHFTVVDASAGRYSAKLLTTSDTEVNTQPYIYMETASNPRAMMC
ncbi:Sds3-like-domain-containing protein [Dichotomocladium elegans]|nr:Sds3-like-domain-containing protein [Dichotomocladium elegans]